MRSGRSGRHSRGVEDARGERRGDRLVLHVGRLHPAAAHVGEHRLLLAGIAEGEARKPARRRHHQRDAERRGVEAIGDRQAFAAGLPFARRHRLVGDEQVVQPAGAGEADLVGRVEHARAIAQQLARIVERDRLQEGLRRQPGPAAEQVVQLVRRHADRMRDLLDLGLRAPVLGNVGDGAAHDGVVVIGGLQAAPDRAGGRGTTWRSPGS